MASQYKIFFTENEYQQHLQARHRERQNYSPVYDGYTVNSLPSLLARFNRYSAKPVFSGFNFDISGLTSGSSILNKLKQSVERSVQLQGLASIATGIGKDLARYDKSRGTAPAGQTFNGQTIPPAGLAEVALGNATLQSASELADIAAAQATRQIANLERSQAERTRIAGLTRDSKLEVLNLKSQLIDIKLQQQLDLLDIGFQKEITSLNRSLVKIRAGIANLKADSEFLHKQYGFNSRALAISVDSASKLRQQTASLYDAGSVFSGPLIASKRALETAEYIGAQAIHSKLNKRIGGGKLLTNTNAIRLSMAGDASLEASVAQLFNNRAKAINTYNQQRAKAEAKVGETNIKAHDQLQKARLAFDKNEAKIDLNITKVRNNVQAHRQEASLLHSLGRALRESYRDQKRFAVLASGIAQAINQESINQVNLGYETFLEGLETERFKLFDSILSGYESNLTANIQTENKIQATLASYNNRFVPFFNQAAPTQQNPGVIGTGDLFISPQQQNLDNTIDNLG